MAKNDNVKDFCKDIADAIREKKGTSDLINPQDFSAEIKSISGGGNGGELEGDWEYYDTRNNPEAASTGPYLGGLQKLAEIRNGVVTPKKIGSFIYAYPSSDYEVVIQIALDYSQLCFDANGKRTLREQIALFPNSDAAEVCALLQLCPRITKEQFYSLE